MAELSAHDDEHGDEVGDINDLGDDLDGDDLVPLGVGRSKSAQIVLG